MKDNKPKSTLDDLDLSCLEKLIDQHANLVKWGSPDAGKKKATILDHVKFLVAKIEFERVD